MNKAAIDAYKQVDKEKGIEEENAYKVIQLLLRGAKDKIELAKNALKFEDLESKGVNISLAVTIFDVLRESLDMENGGEISKNLLSLYVYMSETLLYANLENNIEKMDEVIKLVETIEEGWNGIEKEALELLKENEKQIKDNPEAQVE